MPPPMLSSMCFARVVRADHRDDRVADDVLEKKLRPGPGADLGGRIAPTIRRQALPWNDRCAKVVIPSPPGAN